MSDLTLRDHLAALAMQALLARGERSDIAIESSFQIADAMMRARDGTGAAASGAESPPPEGWRWDGIELRGPHVGETLYFDSVGLRYIDFAEAEFSLDADAAVAVLRRAGWPIGDRVKR